MCAAEMVLSSAYSWRPKCPNSRPRICLVAGPLNVSCAPSTAARSSISFRPNRDANRCRAQMAAARQAIAAAAADHVPFATDDIAGIEIRHVGADLGDLAHEFVPDHQAHRDGLARPIVPLIDVHVGAANARAMHADQDVVDADAGLLDVFQPEAGLIPALDECFHVETLW